MQYHFMYFIKWDLHCLFQKTDHLSKFNVTWELHNKHLFQSIAYTEPSIQSSLHLIISQLRWELDISWEMMYECSICNEN